MMTSTPNRPMRILDRFTISGKETPDEIRDAVRERLTGMGLSPRAVASAQITVTTQVIDMLNVVLTREVELEVVEPGPERPPPPNPMRGSR